MKITHCQIAHLKNPMGYDVGMSEVSYLIEAAEGEKQSSARVRVATDAAMTNVIYDSGERADISPLGFPLPCTLEPRTRYWWQVEAVTDAGDRGASEINWFETGKMDEPWTAQWITCDSSIRRHPIFSCNLAPEKPISQARLYVTALGLYEAYLNGERIGDEYLTPYCNNYHQWLQVQTYDITAQLAKGGRMEIWLGNGWYKGRFCFVSDDHNAPGHYGQEWGLLAEVHVTYKDGTQAVFGTDESWKVRRGPIVDSNLYDGEIWDATLADTESEPVSLYTGRLPSLHDRLSLPVRIQRQLAPVEKIVTPRGEQVLDIGQNQAGIFSLRVHEPRGKTVKIRVGEIMQEGCFYRDNLRSALAEYTFVSDGKEHTIIPHFTFYGYRYVCIEGVDDVKPDDFRALVLHSDLDVAGTITTGNHWINQLLSNVGWGMLSNFIDVPTDCPQRDERMGWTGDAQVFSSTACFYRDCYAFYRKYLYDMKTEQGEMNGAVPVVIPRFQLDEPDGSAVWGDAACIIPWNVYRYYGDPSILEQCFDGMKMWVDFITRTDGDHMGWRTHFHYGDWLGLDNPNPDEITLGGTDNAFIADVYYRHSAVLVAKAARVLGKEQEAQEYEALSDRLLQRIRDEYFTPTGRLAVETQTAHVLALAYGLSPDVQRTRADLRRQFERSGNRLRTGFTGTPLLCPVLSENGMDDLAYQVLLREDYPGWIYQIKLGATTVWERWNSLLPDGTISSTGMNSFNHYAYGSIAEWIWRRCAGLQPLESAPGFTRVRICPMPHRAIGKVEAAYQSASGLWKIGWEIDGDQLTVRFTVPFGCTAEVELPYAPEGTKPGTVGCGTYEITYVPTKMLG